MNIRLLDGEKVKSAETYVTEVGEVVEEVAALAVAVRSGGPGRAEEFDGLPVVKDLWMSKSRAGRRKVRQEGKGKKSGGRDARWER